MLEERESGVVQAQQVWSPVYVDALILRDRNADDNNTNGPSGDGLEQRHYVAQDANFNVTALINAATGAVVERYYYQAYGMPTVLDANFVPRVNGQSQFAWRYLHQGGRFDWAAGYYHFRNRDLSPTLGRWINHDPIGFEGSKWNLYEYVEGRPTVGLDPKGLAFIALPLVPPAIGIGKIVVIKGVTVIVTASVAIYCLTHPGTCLPDTEPNPPESQPNPQTKPPTNPPYFPPTKGGCQQRPNCCLEDQGVVVGRNDLKRCIYKCNDAGVTTRILVVIPRDWSCPAPDSNGIIQRNYFPNHSGPNRGFPYYDDTSTPQPPHGPAPSWEPAQPC